MTFEEWQKAHYIKCGFISSTDELSAAFAAGAQSVSADALDAARYRWLKDIANTEQIGVGESADDFRWLYGDEADAAIDAAMARESAESGGAR